MKKIIAISIACIVTSAVAGPHGDKIEAEAKSNSASYAGAYSQTYQRQSLIYAPTNVEAKEKLIRHDYSGKYAVRSAPSIWAPTAINVAPCTIGVSAGLSVMGGGASIGSGYTDDECQRRADAQILSALGMKDAAIEVLCQSPIMGPALARAGYKCVVPETYEEGTASVNKGSAFDPLAGL